MSITLKVDRTEKNADDMSTYLEEMARQVRLGSIEGEDWEMSGEEEFEEEKPKEENDTDDDS